MAFASEAKNLVGLCRNDPALSRRDATGASGQFVRYADSAPGRSLPPMTDLKNRLPEHLHDLLIAAVDKRLDADAPLGFLLCGGLDSSLVCAIAAAASWTNPSARSAIGMDTDAIDLKYARQAADFIGSRPHGGHHHQGGRARPSAGGHRGLLGT